MSKKEFYGGVFTGFLVATFIACCLCCIYILKTGSSSSGILVANVSSVSAGSVINEESLSKLNTIENIVDKYYIDSVSVNDLEDGMYRGLMSSLGDPYAAYYSEAELAKLMESTEGVFYGIGVYLMYNEEYGYPQVTGIMDDSPASMTNLRVDDFITNVDGKDILGMELSDAVTLIKGEEGTDVTLTIVRRATNEVFDITFTRARVESPTVSYEMFDNGIGYIQIKEFDEVTVEQFTEALANVKGSRAKALILDLRGNPGGSVPAVVDIARELLPAGVIVSTEDKYGMVQEYTCPGEHVVDIPMVVLVNGGSASASEILSGAIKDYGVGTLMGTTTYGKGIVQRILPLEDGSAVKLTVSHYYTPLHNDIHKVGIEPDIVVEFDVDAYLEDENNDNQLDAAKDYLLEQIQ